MTATPMPPRGTGATGMREWDATSQRGSTSSWPPASRARRARAPMPRCRPPWHVSRTSSGAAPSSSSPTTGASPCRGCSAPTTTAAGTSTVTSSRSPCSAPVALCSRSAAATASRISVAARIHGREEDDERGRGDKATQHLAVGEGAAECGDGRRVSSAHSAASKNGCAVTAQIY